MPKKARRECRKPGCHVIVASGYCDAHKHESGFAALDRKKTPETVRFYKSKQWTTVSRLYRQDHPLCERCKAEGRVVPGELVHHDPPLTQLLANGESPFDYEYLQTLCSRCHLAELRARRQVGKGNTRK